VPTPQLLREMQPDAKFIITVNDPVRRMYSDYYFLHDNLKPLRPGMPHNKSGEEFHERAAAQVRDFQECVAGYSALLRESTGSLSLTHLKNMKNKQHTSPSVGDVEFPVWFRAAQM
jgi:hypothetical protein